MNDAKKHTDQRNIHQRLHAVMNAVSYVQKEKKQGMNYTIVSHDAVTAKVRPVLVEHGIVYYPTALSHTQNGNRTEVCLTVRFANIDNPSDFIDVPGLGYGIDQQDKGPGKAVSYAVKYCLLKALGLETGDDPDNESVPHNPEPPATKPNGRKPADPAGGAHPVTTPRNQRKLEDVIRDETNATKTVADLEALRDQYKRQMNEIKASSPEGEEAFARMVGLFSARKAALVNNVGAPAPIVGAGPKPPYVLTDPNGEPIWRTNNPGEYIARLDEEMTVGDAEGFWASNKDEATRVHRHFAKADPRIEKSYREMRAVVEGIAA